MIVPGSGFLVGPLTASDTYWGNVVLLMHMDGADNGTTFTDVKGKTVTVVGGVTTKVAQKRFGTASAYFDGVDANNSHLTLADNPDWHFPGAYTIEFWIYPMAYEASNSWLFLQADQLGSSCPIRLDLVSSGLVGVLGSTDNLAWLFTTDNISSHPCPLNAWSHVALADDGTTCRLFINGTLSWSRATWTKTDSSQPLRIGGAFTGGDREFQGYIDDLRVTKGVARYTSNFTPPSEPFPNQ